MEETWTRVDEYFVEHLAPSDDVLDAALSAAEAAGLPAIQVTAAQGKLLAILARISRARRILEIGTLGGYSTIWLGRALPADGQLITLEIEAEHAAVARQNLARAGLTDRVQVWLAPALESLERLLAGRIAPFDLIFIDADKPNIPRYFDAALRLSHSGTAIVIDNVVRKGEVANDETMDDNVLGVRALVSHLAHEPRVSATAVQTVGGKGYDGFILAVVE